MKKILEIYKHNLGHHITEVFSDAPRKPRARYFTKIGEREIDFHPIKESTRPDRFKVYMAERNLQRVADGSKDLCNPTLDAEVDDDIFMMEIDEQDVVLNIQDLGEMMKKYMGQRACVKFTEDLNGIDKNHA